MTGERETNNADREIWRGPDEGNGDYYADSLHITKDGALGINVGGNVIVRPLKDWHALATSPSFNYGIEAAAKYHDQADLECDAIAAVNADNDLGLDCLDYAVAHRVDADAIRSLSLPAQEDR